MLVIIITNELDKHPKIITIVSKQMEEPKIFKQ